MAVMTEAPDRSHPRKLPPIALTIAGSDSGGGAGIQADLKTFHQFRVYGTSVVVAVTAQNTVGVRGISTIPEDIVAAQLAALAEDLPPAALKTGMLATPSLVHLVADAIQNYSWRCFTLDPVMVASSGDRLLTSEAESTMRERLLPLAALITPNLDEAEILTGMEVRDSEAMKRAGQRLLEMGARAVLMKGGHLASADAIDLLVVPGTTRRFTHPRIQTTSTHGTGCTLSAAVTAGLALGQSLERAVIDALDFVHRAIEESFRIGAGHGPLNHWVAVNEKM
ncbi:MAG: bifunctional hydroxymethylpyrimidine kinase/phosphomethylpyrimidine kinase [Gemmatimonadota bacterium]